MKYVQHYRIANDEIIQIEYADDVIIPAGIEVRTSPFPDLEIKNDDGLTAPRNRAELKLWEYRPLA